MVGSQIGSIVPRGNGPTRPLVPEVTQPGKHHRNTGSVCGGDYLSVTHRAAGLDDCRDPGFDRRLDPIGEGEERVEASTEPMVGDRDSPAARPISVALAAAIFTASTRFIWPAPMPTVAPPRAKTIAFDLTCFTTLSANSRSAISVSLGARRVTVRSASRPTESRSRSCTSIPPDTERNCFPAPRVRHPSGHQQPQRRSPGENVRPLASSGAMTTSMNRRPIASAVAASRDRLSATMPP